MSFTEVKTVNLDVNTINGAAYPPATTPTLPTYFHSTISTLNFGFSSDANKCFTQGTAAAPYYWAPASLPAPSTTQASCDGSENYGTIAVSLPAGNYGLSGTFLASPGTGIAHFNINGTIQTIDTYTSDTSNENRQFFYAFTVTGTGWQTTLINLSCGGKNPSSTDYDLLPTESWFIDVIYTGGPPSIFSEADMEILNIITEVEQPIIKHISYESKPIMKPKFKLIEEIKNKPHVTYQEKVTNRKNKNKKNN
jgi:hypothetical protein